MDEPYLQILNIAYTINSIDELELRIEFLIDGVLYQYKYRLVFSVQYPYKYFVPYISTPFLF